jgi:hypothetical protein
MQPAFSTDELRDERVYEIIDGSGVATGSSW